MRQTDKIALWASVPEQLARLVVTYCSAYHLPVKAVRSDSRKASLVRCRTGISKRARDMGYSYPVIARALNRDHSSIMHLVRKAG